MYKNDADAIIENHKGYKVSFEEITGGLLRSDHVPESHEPPFATEDEAWEYAEHLAAATMGRFVNLYVIHAGSFLPVAGYLDRKIANR